jgi:DNA (cytosine-5)-methyltransferase 1
VKPRLLDLFCGAGGATKGYQRAGFHVTGVDIVSQPNYCGDEFVQADALEFLWYLLDHAGPAATYNRERFDVIHASPPCQRYTMAQNAAQNAHAHPDLLDESPLRDLLVATGLPYVIENVVGSPLCNPVMICGLSLGLNVKRHRLFESNMPLMVPPCTGHDRDYFVIFGHECRNRRTGTAAGRKNRIAVGREAMDIDWMTRGELSEAIPPAYTELIGHQLLQALRYQAAA